MSTNQKVEATEVEVEATEVSVPIETPEVTEVQANEVEATEVPEPVIVFDGDTVTVDGVVVDRKKLDTKLVGKFKSVETTFSDIGALIVECQEAKVWLDPKVTDAEGKPFKNWAAYLSNRLSEYPLANKALSKTMIETLLAAGMSVRAAARAANVSHGKAFTVSQEMKGKGKGKRAPRPNDGTVEQDEAGLASTPATNAKKIATQVVNALAKADGAVGDMSAEDVDLVIAAATQTLGIFQGMKDAQSAEADAA